MTTLTCRACGHSKEEKDFAPAGGYHGRSQDCRACERRRPPVAEVRLAAAAERAAASLEGIAYSLGELMVRYVP